MLNSRSSIALLLAGVLAGAAHAGTAATGKKVPVTTASVAAREAFMRGRDLAEKLRIQPARLEFERAVQLDPEFAMAYASLAATQPTTKEFFASLAKAEALAGHATAGERLIIRGAVAGGNGDNAAQLEIYQELAAQFPDDERVLTLLGNAQFAMQDYAACIPQYEKAVRIAPGFSPVYNQMGYAYRFLNQPAKAEIAFKRYVELIPDDPNPYDSYAELLLKLGRFDDAIASYRKALAIDPAFINSSLGIATCLDLQGKFDAARHEVDAMLAGAKDDGQRRAGLFAKTVSFVHQGDYKAAQAEVDKQYALGERTNDTLPMSGDLVLKATLELEAGDVAAAEAHFRRAMELVEASPAVGEVNKANQRRLQAYRAGRVALARNDLPAAKAATAAFTAQVATSGSSFQKKLAHELAGQVALAENDYDAAIAELGQANSQDPYNAYRLSLAYAGKGDTAQAKALAAQAYDDNTLTNLNHAFVRQLLRKGGHASTTVGVR